MTPERIKINLLVFMLAAFSLVAILFSTANFELEQKYKSEVAHLEETQNILRGISIMAKAVSIYNITQNKKIYGRNDEVAMPIASLAKILTVAVALSNHPEDDIVSVTSESINQAGDFGLYSYEKWRMSDLAKLTLLVSANDGAYTLADEPDFLEQLNTKAKKIGMNHTLFLNPTGLDIDLTQAGVFASAHDVNVMAMYSIRAYPEVFEVTRIPEINLVSESGFIHNLKNTDIIVEKIPNLIFSKTGFTEVAGGNLAVVFRNRTGEEIAVTLLGSTFDDRFSDMEKLVNVLFRLP